jgi:hypothetical protein
MIPVTGGTRMFLFRGRADMRKGFDGLSGMVEANFTESLFSKRKESKRKEGQPFGEQIGLRGDGVVRTVQS